MLKLAFLLSYEILKYNKTDLCVGCLEGFIEWNGMMNAIMV